MKTELNDKTITILTPKQLDAMKTTKIKATKKVKNVKVNATKLDEPAKPMDILIQYKEIRGKLIADRESLLARIAEINAQLGPIAPKVMPEPQEEITQEIVNS